MFLILVIIAIAALIYFKIMKPNKYWEEKGISYVKPHFVFGNMAPNVFRTKALAQMVKDMYDAYPDKRYVGMWQFLQPTLILRDLDLIKRITVKEFDSFPDHRSFSSGDADPLASKNLFNLSGEQGWHDMRSTLSPAFTSSKMRAMFVLMDKCASQFVDHFDNKDNKVIQLEIKDAFTRFTNDVIGTTAFGVNCNSLEDRNNEFYLMGKDLTNISGLRALKFFAATLSPALMKLFKITIFSKEVGAFFRRVVKETMRVREEQHVVRPDMIHLLMEARKGQLKHDDQGKSLDTGFAVVQESEIGKRENKQKAAFTDDDITAQALIFFFAGFDTTATLMCLAAYELAVNPDIQEKLIEEISKSCQDQVTYETLLGMKYLDCVITETLRKWPPAAFLDRKSVKAFTIEPELPGEKPLHLEEGSIVWMPVYGIHMDPNYYPDPEKFDPERFNEENKRNINPFSYLPFGTGPRNCIGSRFALLESKLIIVKLLQKFNIVPIKKTEVPFKMSKSTFNLIPTSGIWLGLKPRSTS